MTSTRVQRDQPHGMEVFANSTAVTELPRQTPVVASVDVLVVGGGPAGVGAALAAAKEGAKTLLIERYGMLGGMWTAGLVNPLFDFHCKGWIVAELIERLQAANAWMKWRHAATFDREAMKWTLEEMMTEAGVELWYYSLVVDAIVEDDAVLGAIVESKAGREGVLARVVVDASGDGDVAARAGAPYEMGRAVDGAVQPVTLMFEISGIGDYECVSALDLYDQMTEAIEHDGMDVELHVHPIVLDRLRHLVVQIERGHTLVVTDPGDLEHEGDRLHSAINRASHLVRRPSAGRHVPVPGCVHHDSCKHALPAGLALHDRAQNRVILDDRIHDQAVIPQLDPSLRHHFLERPLHGLPIERSRVAPLHPCIRGLESLDQLRDDPALAVEVEQRIHEPGGPHPSEHPVSLDEESLRPLLRRGKSRTDSRRPSTDDEHVHAGYDRRLAGELGDRSGVRENLHAVGLVSLDAGGGHEESFCLRKRRGDCPLWTVRKSPCGEGTVHRGQSP